MEMTGKEARAVVYGDVEGWEEIEKGIIDHGRWSVSYRAIHKHVESGKYYKFVYRIGATECQYERPYEYQEQDKVPVIEVHQVEKTVLVWEAVK